MDSAGGVKNVTPVCGKNGFSRDKEITDGQKSSPDLATLGAPRAVCAREVGFCSKPQQVEEKSLVSLRTQMQVKLQPHILAPDAGQGTSLDLFHIQSRFIVTNNLDPHRQKYTMFTCALHREMSLCGY